jgi:hypothetical protein
VLRRQQTGREGNRGHLIDDLESIAGLTALCPLYNLLHRYNIKTCASYNFVRSLLPLATNSPRTDP